MGLNISKIGLHWMFGLAMNTSYALGVTMYLPQIWYFSAGTVMTAGFISFIAFRRPSGYLPATYVHIQTIIDIVDEWLESGPMFWGHKGGPRRGELVCYAGTSTDQLEPPMEKSWYGGNPQQGLAHAQSLSQALVNGRNDGLYPLLSGEVPPPASDDLFSLDNPSDILGNKLV